MSAAKRTLRCRFLLFEYSALGRLSEYTSGSPKATLRLAANSLIEAALDEKNISCIISSAHVKKAWLRSTSELAEILDEGEIRVLTALEKLHEASPSSEKLQKEASLSRPSLTKILLRLRMDGHVRRRKKGQILLLRLVPSTVSVRLVK